MRAKILGQPKFEVSTRPQILLRGQIRYGASQSFQGSAERRLRNSLWIGMTSQVHIGTIRRLRAV